MVRKLTERTSKDGKVYQRPPHIEAAIGAALRLNLTTLQKRAGIAHVEDPEYIHSEVLVHLIRKALRDDDRKAGSALLRVLQERCMRTLRSRIRDSNKFDAQSIREDVIGRLSERFAEDLSLNGKKRLDFFEARYNLAFQALYFTVLREKERELRLRVELPASDEADDLTEDEAFGRLDLPQQPPSESPEDQYAIRKFFELAEALPKKEQEAVVLRHVYGYDVESNNPNKGSGSVVSNPTCAGRDRHCDLV